MKSISLLVIILGLQLLLPPQTMAWGTDHIFTNSVIIPKPPSWLKRVRVEKVTDRIETELEWRIRRIKVYMYSDQQKFAKAHSLGPTARAVTKSFGHGEKAKITVHLGPEVNDKNFDQVFGHELVHVIFRQKYVGAIPLWLEEGLANYLSKKEAVDYKWMAKQKFPDDVRKLTHPFMGSLNRAIYHYKASQALTEMIAKKCDLTNLLRLSVQRKMADYIYTYCEIKDINKEFRQWVKKKAG